MIKKLDISHIEKIVEFLPHLNPGMSLEIMRERQVEMLKLDNYTCFGYFENDELTAICSCWHLVKIYSGKQIEVDNFITKPNLQSKGIGKYFLSYIEDYARKNGYESVELNTLVSNDKSHKFYFNEGYRILGYHFEKKLKD